jgi:hypothetical protein
VILAQFHKSRWHRCDIQYKYCRPPGAKSALATRGHRQPTKKSESSRIIIGFGRSPNVPGLISALRLVRSLVENQEWKVDSKTFYLHNP